MSRQPAEAQQPLKPVSAHRHLDSGRARATLLVGALCGILISDFGTAAQQPPPQPQEVRPAQVLPPANDVAAAVQRRYEAIKDFSADFKQLTEVSTLRRKATESGTVHIKKPGKMRWDYAVPEKKLFISDGRTMFMYFPRDRQVMKNPLPQQEEATSAVLFLLGMGNVVRDFAVRFGESRGDDSVYVLRLEPRKRQAEYDWLQVTVDRKTFQIRELAWGDAQGGRNTIALSNFKENTGLADNMFQFSIPRGTEVITSGKTH